MSKVRGIAKSSAGAAVIGGLVVATLGWVAIAAGWVHGSSGDSTVAQLSPAPLPQPAAQQTDGKGLTVNEIYRKDSPGVAFVSAQQKAQSSSRSTPSGAAEGAKAAGSRPGRGS